MAEIRPMGESALLIDFSTAANPLARVLRAHSAVKDLTGVIDAVPAAQTLLIRFDGSARTYASAVKDAVERSRAENVDVAKHKSVTIPVTYNGPDLAPLAEQLGMSAEALITWHTQMPWVAAFGGFAPGFYYLVRGEGQGFPPAHDVPRLTTPRTHVPKGAVGLAGRFAGVYPIESPGGWQLLGRTDVEMWDLHRGEPALLAPGTRVQFEPVRQGVNGSEAAQ